MGAFVCAVVMALSAIGPATATTRLEFITAYIGTLAEHEEIRETNARELAEDQATMPKTSAALMTMIRGAERYILRLSTEIYMFKAMKLAPPFADTPTMTAQTLERKRDIFRLMQHIATEFQSGPKPGVDYGNLAAAMAKMNAQLEESDRVLFTIAKMTALMVADADSTGGDRDKPISRMVLTCAERDQLVRSIQTNFGAKLDDQNSGFVVAAGWMIRQGLTKPEWKCQGSR